MKETVEMESKEEELLGQATQEGEAQADELAAPDYASFTKKDFVNLLKELLQEADFRRYDAIIREVKSHFTEQQERERIAALHKFLEGGGNEDDFQFRRDDLDASFDATYRVLRDKRLEQLRSLEAQRTDNLRIKNELLEDLRKLVESNDDKHSFEKFKEIQQRWKTTGPVPSGQSRTIWANYHALVDRFYDNRNIYFELKELDRKKNLEAKLELCARAENLAHVEKLSDALKELNDLHEEYKHIGPVSRDEKEAVWERFKRASDAVYARRDEHMAELQEKLRTHLEAKQQIIAEIEPYSTFASDRIKEWNQKTQEILSLQKRWEGAGAIPRSATREINRKFWSAFKAFFQRKSQFFKKLDEERKANLELKRQLVTQAEALKDSEAYDKAAQELKNLQVRWKEIGPVPDKFRESVYNEFKAACDYFFNRKRTKVSEEDRQQDENLVRKEALCASLEKLIAEKSGTLDHLREIRREFQAIGFVPRKAVATMRKRFTDLVDQFLEHAEGVTPAQRDKVRMEFELENLRSDPDASYKIHQKEQGLRKQITRVENDMATLKNNLEFFARSKNADKLREEYNAKIEQSAKDLQDLKSQLKLLRAEKIV